MLEKRFGIIVYGFGMNGVVVVLFDFDFCRF